MKKVALSLLALALVGSMAFGQTAMAPAPTVQLSGYVGAGGYLSGSGNQDTKIQGLDRNNGGPVDFRLNFTLAGDTTGLKFSLWNETNGTVAATQLEYTYAWASFLDKQLVTKVGLQDDSTTAGPINSLGSNDNGNGTGTNNAVANKFPAPTNAVTFVPASAVGTTTGSVYGNSSGNTPAFDVVFSPAQIPGFALDYYLPLGWVQGYAPDAFGLSRIGAAYSVAGLVKVTANYELDQTVGTKGSNGPLPSFNFGLTFSGVENLTVRADGSIVTNSSAYAATELEQDIGYVVKLNDTDSVKPYLFVREWLIKTSGPSAATGYSAFTKNNAGDSYTSFELMPQLAYATTGVTYAVDADVYVSGASLVTNAVGTTYAIQPNVTWALPGSQTIQVGASYGTLGKDVSDGGGAGQNYGTAFDSKLGQVAGYDVFVNYEYAF